MAAFVLHGTIVGSLYARLPDLQAALGLSEGTYGLVLMGMPAGILAGAMQVHRAIETWGPRRVMLTVMPLGAIWQVALSFAPGPASLGLGLFVLGLALASANVSINVEADRFLAARGVSILNRCHGWWAVGFLATSLAASGLVRLGVSPQAQFGGQAVLFVAAVLAALVPLPESLPRPGALRARRFALPNRATLAILLWATAGILMEGTSRGWLVIYLRDQLGAIPSVAALALPAILLTQTAGRFFGDRAIEGFGIVRTARAASAVLAVGTLGVVATQSVPVALAGCMLIGLGIAINAPQAIAAAARLPDRPAAESVAAITALSTVLTFLGPPIFGGLAEAIGLRATLALMVPLPLVAIACARVLDPAGRH